MEKAKIISLVQNIVELLVKKQYDEVASNDYKKIMNSGDIKELIADYGGDLTLPPTEEYQLIDIYIYIYIYMK